MGYFQNIAGQDRSPAGYPGFRLSFDVRGQKYADVPVYQTKHYRVIVDVGRWETRPLRQWTKDFQKHAGLQVDAVTRLHWQRLQSPPIQRRRLLGIHGGTGVVYPGQDPAHLEPVQHLEQTAAMVGVQMG